MHTSCAGKPQSEDQGNNCKALKNSDSADVLSAIYKHKYYYYLFCHFFSVVILALHFTYKKGLNSPQ